MHVYMWWVYIHIYITVHLYYLLIYIIIPKSNQIQWHMLQFGCMLLSQVIDPSFHNVESNFNNLCTQHWPVHPPMLQVSLRKTSMTDMHIEAQQVFGWYSCGNGAKQEGIERRGWRVYRTWVDEWIIWASNWHYNAHATVIHRGAHTYTHTAYVRIYSTYVLNKDSHAKSNHNPIAFSLHGLVHSQSTVHGQACSCSTTARSSCRKVHNYKWITTYEPIY